MTHIRMLEHSGIQLRLNDEKRRAELILLSSEEGEEKLVAKWDYELFESKDFDPLELKYSDNPIQRIGYNAYVCYLEDRLKKLRKKNKALQEFKQHTDETEPKFCNEECEHAGPRDTSFYTVQCHDGIMCKKIDSVICKGSACPDWIGEQLIELIELRKFKDEHSERYTKKPPKHLKRWLITNKSAGNTMNIYGKTYQITSVKHVPDMETAEIDLELLDD